MHNIVVTGGSRGIGLAIAETLANVGYNVYNVIVIARNVETGLQAIKTTDGSSRAINFISWDLSEIKSLAALAAKIRNEFGAVYGLVNNAGIGTAGILATMPDNDIQQLITMNTISPIILTKNIVRQMINARSGRIVNISSIVANTGFPGLATYSATKASMIGFTKSLAREVGSLGITVNAVAPGFVDTEMTHSLNDKQREQIARRSALQRMATASDVAQAVEFLLSEKAKNITGTVVTVDAGNTA